MSNRCEHRAYYVAGVKVASGEATALTPTGRRQVVCRNAGPGQVNVQELADGTPIDVPRIGILAFDASAWQGKRGRSVDVVNRAAGMRPGVRTAYLRRVAATRTDLPAVLAVLGSSHRLPSGVLHAMMRRSRSQWGAIIDATLADDAAGEMCSNLTAAMPVIDDIVLLHHIGRQLPTTYYSAGLAAAALTQLARLGHERDAAAIIKAALTNEAASVDRYANCYDTAVAALSLERFEELASSLLEQAPLASVIMLMTAVSIAHDTATPAGNEPAWMAAMAGLLRAADKSTWEFATAAHIAPGMVTDLERRMVHTTTRPHAQRTADVPWSASDAAWHGVSDDDLLAEFVSDASGPFGPSAQTALEIVKRPMPNHPTLKHPDVRWMRLMHQSKLFSDDELVTGFWNTKNRVAAVKAAPVKDLAFMLAGPAAPTPGVLLAVLDRLDDIELWRQWTIRAPDIAQSRHLLELVPASVLVKLVEHPSAQMHPLTWEVATYRGALAPATALTSQHQPVRLAAVMCARDAAVIATALQDPEPSVQRAAIKRCRDLAALTALSASFGHLAPPPETVTDLEARIHQLRLVELVGVAMSRHEVEVARAALAGITARELLNDLVVHHDLLAYVAQRLEALTLRPRSRHWTAH